MDVLIRRRQLEAIVAGTVTLAFRRWKRPTVKQGGTLRTVVGVVAIERVDPVDEERITEAEARRAGFSSRAGLVASLAGDDGGRTLYRIELRFAGADPRVALRQRAELTTAEVEEIGRRLARLDAASRHGPWTVGTLGLIERHPQTLAAELAARGGWEKAWFKTNVRKLKELGLTESLKRGYRLSPRGRSYLAHCSGPR